MIDQITGVFTLQNPIDETFLGEQRETNVGCDGWSGRDCTETVTDVIK